MNKKNLQRLADFIRKVPESKFDMKKYRRGDMKEHICNSVGCIIGLGTALVEENELPRRNDGSINFTKFSEQFTGIYWGSDEWDWCFDSSWSEVDNTPEGAAKRIEYLLKNGLPEN